MGRPFVIASCAMTLDGYIDDAGDERLLLSNDADFDRVDEVRASVDAILVGAGTIRADNPRLLVRSAQRRAERVARGQSASPLKVALSRGGDLDPDAAFFTTGESGKIVYCAGAAHDLRDRLAGRADVVGIAGLTGLLEDLAERGVERLLVEGGTSVHTQFLAADLVDELQLVIAPLLIGDHRAPRFVGDGAYRYTGAHRLRLVEVRPIGDCALLRYHRPAPGLP